MDDETGVDLQLDRPHAARMYDYYLGGRTNFPADREAVGRVMAAFPTALVTARANREFMHRSTRYLARRGLRQFLDIGTGIPTSPNLHEIAQEVSPDARIVYVDNDPIVLTHAQALLRSHPAGRTAYVEADLRKPGSILSAPALHETLDLSRPVALSLNSVLPFVADDLDVSDEFGASHDAVPDQRGGDTEGGAYAIVERLKDAVAPGSALVISHGTSDFAPEASEKASMVYRSSVGTLQPRTRADFTRFFAGWDLVEPGVTVAHRWRPDEHNGLSSVTDAEVSCYAAVAFKIE
ncbi:SAM-dependent methyltransferase [Actinocrinis puniceicyclus]|uniref:SAM-dependent methyltransferase n=1 Tax=Actinocrinis puniceicyclus TaxID=977794 RepID=A0A8J7WLX4_9ACTN|nr:SAM-dependent methyltransferase [Actinocrinis puniceicyclus]MBS2963230.1 SAM-dependent methyltransferase [Actinocrinis puniceicyclus]